MFSVPICQGSQYWRLTEEAVAPGYPRPISSDWGGMPSDLDAAFTYSNGKTYFFKGNQYWRFTGNQRDGGYPRVVMVPEQIVKKNK